MSLTIIELRMIFITHQYHYHACRSFITMPFPHSNRCIGELERKERDYLFTQDSGEDPEGLRKRQKQREKEDLVTQSGKATDNLASISRQLAETVER